MKIVNVQRIFYMKFSCQGSCFFQPSISNIEFFNGFNYTIFFIVLGIVLLITIVLIIYLNLKQPNEEDDFVGVTVIDEDEPEKFPVSTNELLSEEGRPS